MPIISAAYGSEEARAASVTLLLDPGNAELEQSFGFSRPRMSRVNRQRGRAPGAHAGGDIAEHVREEQLGIRCFDTAAPGEFDLESALGKP
jgi:hypothetical protein